MRIEHGSNLLGDAGGRYLHTGQVDGASCCVGSEYSTDDQGCPLYRSITAKMVKGTTDYSINRQWNAMCAHRNNMVATWPGTRVGWNGESGWVELGGMKGIVNFLTKLGGSMW